MRFMVKVGGSYTTIEAADEAAALRAVADLGLAVEEVRPEDFYDRLLRRGKKAATAGVVAASSAANRAADGARQMAANRKERAAAAEAKKAAGALPVIEYEGGRAGRGRPADSGTLKCPHCAGAMAMQTHMAGGCAGPALGIVLVVFGLMPLGCGGFFFMRVADPRLQGDQASQGTIGLMGVAGIAVGLIIILLGALCFRTKKVWRCRDCGSIIARSV